MKQNRNRVRLTESQLKQMIAESVKRVLNEINDNVNNNEDDIFADVVGTYNPYGDMDEYERNDSRWGYQRVEWFLSFEDGERFHGTGPCIKIPYKYKEYFPKNIWDIYFPLGYGITNQLMRRAQELGIYQF